MSYIYDLWKRKLLELELNVMERYSDERLEKVVEKAKHSMGVAGEAAECARASAEKLGETIRETSLGLDISHHSSVPEPGLKIDGDDISWTSFDPLDPLDPHSSIWVALYGGSRKPRFNFSASQDDLDLDFEDFGMNIQQFSTVFGLTATWDPHKPTENYIRCPITSQQINLDHFRARGLLPS